MRGWESNRNLFETGDAVYSIHLLYIYLNPECAGGLQMQLGDSRVLDDFKTVSIEIR